MPEIKRYGASLAHVYKRKAVEAPPIPTKPIKSVDAPKVIVPTDKEKPATPVVAPTKEKDVKPNEKPRS